AHIDTAWLWPLRETRRKCLRTFATALRLMERFDDFRFACTQPQQYAWIERDAPELFAQIAARVAEGRWEPTGAMWVEPDCNVPGGESLVRQLLYGIRYFRTAFGDAAPQHVLYLPDTFGFPPALPQLMDLAGLDTFVTNKLAWNRTNRFPHATFRWRGLDGTEVLAHCLPGEDYNATVTPRELRRGERVLVAKGGAAACPAWLQPFGYGDGGGGPTAAMIHAIGLAGACEGLPAARLSSIGAFRRELRDQHARLRDAGRDLPLWDGELDLELHRGTYTSQGWLKRANRRAERELRAAEWLTGAGPVAAEEAAATDATERLGEAWRLLLLNQFHDILPGSSIAAVSDEARAQLDHVHDVAGTLVEDGIRRWAGAVATGAARRPALVLNETSWPRTGVFECDGEPCFAADVPALGARVVDRDAEPEALPARAEGDVLVNGLLSATIDAGGRIADLRRPGSARGATHDEGGPLNQLVLYEDLPRRWEAWDIDEEYTECSEPVTGPATRRTVVADGPLRVAIEVELPLGAASRIVQRFVLDAGSPCLVVHATIDWHEDRRLLRALFPFDVRTRHVTCGTQLGHAVRPGHRNSPWERARYEWCVHGWMDLSEPGFGAALLSDGIYGQSGHDSVLGLSLLRGPLFPDPGADRGVHELTYGVMLHDGDWRGAGVDREAARLQAPLRAVPLLPAQTGPVAATWAPLRVDVRGGAGVEITAVKRAEDDDRTIVRL
ncbi:MAG: alpha-mannosidase, partial [Planctomycetota bacterium]